MPTRLAFLGVLLLALSTSAIAQGPRPAATPPPSAYVVDGLALYGQVRPGSEAYKQYQCGPSDKFAGFTWCHKEKTEKTSRGEVTTSNSILHGQDGTAVYLNRYIEPEIFGPNDVRTEIAKLSAKFGERAREIRMPKRAGSPDAVIAIWGAIALEPLDAKDVSIVASGGSPATGLLVGFLGDLQRSAKAGIPVYRLAGGPGYLWAASFNAKGRGVLRFLAADASKVAAPAAPGAPAAPAAPPVPAAPIAQDVAPQPPAVDAEAAAQRKITDVETARRAADDAVQRRIAEAEAGRRDAVDEAQRRIAEAQTAQRAAAESAVQAAAYKSQIAEWKLWSERILIAAAALIALIVAAAVLLIVRLGRRAKMISGLAAGQAATHSAAAAVIEKDMKNTAAEIETADSEAAADEANEEAAADGVSAEKAAQIKEAVAKVELDISALLHDGLVIVPETQVSAPEAQVSAPEAQVSAPEAQVSAPEAQVSAPEVQASPPEVSAPKSAVEELPSTPNAVRLNTGE